MYHVGVTLGSLWIVFGVALARISKTFFVFLTSRLWLVFPCVSEADIRKRKLSIYFDGDSATSDADSVRSDAVSSASYIFSLLPDFLYPNLLCLLRAGGH